MFRLVIDYLTLRETCNLFKVNKNFSMLRYDNFIIKSIGWSCIYSNNINLIKYMNKLIKHGKKYQS